MSLKEDILLYLEESSNYVSGEYLAKKFGKSRAGVWKAVKSLKEDGIKIDAVTNKGYILNEDNDLISKDKIKAHLNENIDVFYFNTIDSTNNEAKRMLSKNYNGIGLIVANEQQSGRGRQGKSFFSPPFTGIYMSLIVHPNTSLQNAVSATTAASVAVCKAIEKLTDRKPQIKWVNDVFLDGRKICGILTEAISNFELQTVESVVIGVGMNIKTIEFPDNVENAGCLNYNISRSTLIAEIANELIKVINNDYDSFIDYYISHSMIIGKDINFIENGKITPARVISIDKTGGLEVMLKNGEKRVLRSGEISIRRA